MQNLVVWEASQPDLRAREINAGEWPAWSPADDALVTSLVTPNRVYLTGYNVDDRSLVMPILTLPLLRTV